MRHPDHCTSHQLLRNKTTITFAKTSGQWNRLTCFGPIGPSSEASRLLLVLLELITPIIIGEKNKIWMSLIYDFLCLSGTIPPRFLLRELFSSWRLKVIRAYVRHDHWSFLNHHGGPGRFIERNSTTRRWQIGSVTSHEIFLLLLLPVTFFVSQSALCVRVRWAD